MKGISKGYVQKNENQPAKIGSPSAQHIRTDSFSMMDSRPEAIRQRKIQASADSSPVVQRLAQMQALADKRTKSSAKGLVQFARTKESRPRKVSSSKLRILRLIDNYLRLRLWRFLMENNPGFKFGALQQRGQETNNILNPGEDHQTEVTPHGREKFEAFARHLSSVLAGDEVGRFTEVQAATTFTDDSRTRGHIYVSANTNPTELQRDWDSISERAQNLLTKGNISERLARHCRKAIDEISQIKDSFGISVVTAGLQGQHAETRIDGQIQDDKAVYGGLRRPCGACVLYFSLRGRRRVLPAHQGQFWTTINAMTSIRVFAKNAIYNSLEDWDKRRFLSPYYKKHTELVVDKWLSKNSDKLKLRLESFVQKGQTLAAARGADTDSEDDTAPAPAPAPDGTEADEQSID